MNKITCIIINFKTPEQSKELWDTLRGADLDLVLVDNSPSTTPAELTQSTGTYTYLANQENIGFGAAANKGAQGAKGEWILFLNPDVHVSPNAIKKFVQQAEDEKLDACCPKTTDPCYTHPLPSMWWFLGTYTPLKRVQFFLTQANKYPVTLWGGCLLIRRSVFESLKGFDERFFLWFEDSDLTKRLLDRGYNIGYVPVEGLTHTGGLSFETMSETDKRRIFFQSASTYVYLHGSLLDKMIVGFLQLRYGGAISQASQKTQI